VPGGEVSLLRVGKVLDTVKVDGSEEKVGVEIVRKALETVTALPPPPALASPPASQGSDGILPDYAKNATAENKLEIEYLVELAATRGILEASKIAQETSPFVLDAFHDALTGKLYDELVKSGVLK
jgi:hypothetical protein